jgi:hypothetical protein
MRTSKGLWSNRYDDGIEHLFDLQDRITKSIVGAIHPSIFLAEIDRAKRKRPESLDAYDNVLRALAHVWALDPTTNTTALNYLKSYRDRARLPACTLPGGTVPRSTGRLLLHLRARRGQS